MGRAEAQEWNPPLGARTERQPVTVKRKRRAMALGDLRAPRMWDSWFLFLFCFFHFSVLLGDSCFKYWETPEDFLE